MAKCLHTNVSKMSLMLIKMSIEFNIFPFLICFLFWIVICTSKILLLYTAIVLTVYAVIFKEYKFHKFYHKFVKKKFLSLKNSSKSVANALHETGEQWKSWITFCIIWHPQKLAIYLLWNITPTKISYLATFCEI